MLKSAHFALANHENKRLAPGIPSAKELSFTKDGRLKQDGRQSQKVSDLAMSILAYLAEYPNARDTWEGIIEWWLMERRMNYWEEEVTKALSELVQQDLIVAARGGDLRIHYRINPYNPTAIQKVLGKVKERKG